MAKTPLFAMASLLLALTFTVSCTDDGGDENQSSSSINDELSSSSQIAEAGGGNRQSSSSIDGSSSSSATADAGNNSSSSLVNIGSSSSTITSGGGNFEGSKFTMSYAITNLTANSFTYIHTYEDHYCAEGGILLEDTDVDYEDINYSINNRVLVWEYSWDNDSLHFAGTSNNLIGEWTRTKNKNASCELNTHYEEWDCKPGWDIVKAEFTQSIVKITREACITDRMYDGEEWRGWKYATTGCNTYEIYKGADRIYVEYTGTLLSYNEMSVNATYKGKTCVNSRTLAQQEKACKKAWDEYGSTDRDWRDYYWDFLESDFEECIKEKGFPEELLSGYDDGDSYGAVSAKPLPKQKSLPKLLLRTKSKMFI